MPKSALAKAKEPQVQAKERPATADGRAARILARSLFRDMRSNGHGPQQILALATELIELVTQEMRGEAEGAACEPGLVIVAGPKLEA